MKIAIVKLSALGDIIHAMIVLQFIKKYNQKIEIDWVVEENYQDLLEHHPDINNVHTVNIKKAKKSQSVYLLIKEFRKAKNFGPYDLVIDMQGLIKSAFITRLIPSPIKIGFDKNSIREAMASKLYNQTYKINYSVNVVERSIGLISSALGLNINKFDILNKEPFLYSNKEYISKKIPATNTNIGLIVGASFASKLYPAEKYVELISKIEANFFIFWGNSVEKKIAFDIKSSSPGVIILNKLSLSELVSSISQMNLLIGSDTGPTHMAWALNIPSITLYGPTPGSRNTLVTNINKIIESNSKVNPRKINKNDYSIKNIQVNEIVKMAQKLLNIKK